MEKNCSRERCEKMQMSSALQALFLIHTGIFPLCVSVVCWGHSVNADILFHNAMTEGVKNCRRKMGSLFSQKHHYNNLSGSKYMEQSMWGRKCDLSFWTPRFTETFKCPLHLRGVNITSSNALSQSAQRSSSKVSLRHFILYLSTNGRKKFVFQCMDSYGLWVETADGLNLSWNVHQEKTLFCKEICVHNLKLCVYRQ